LGRPRAPAGQEEGMEPCFPAPSLAWGNDRHRVCFPSVQDPKAQPPCSNVKDSSGHLINKYREAHWPGQGQGPREGSGRIRLEPSLSDLLAQRLSP
jgi:hypothetical protein